MSLSVEPPAVTVISSRRHLSPTLLLALLVTLALAAGAVVWAVSTTGTGSAPDDGAEAAPVNVLRVEPGPR